MRREDVDPGFRRKAVGRQMLDAMLEHFRRRGARSVQTLVDEEMGEIRSFFSALGFQPSTLTPFVRPL